MMCLRIPFVGAPKFDTKQKAWLSLDGAANVDEFDCPARGFKGMSTRALDLKTHHWPIYWINSTFGKLLNPVMGRFRGTQDVVYCRVLKCRV